MNKVIVVLLLIIIVLLVFGALNVQSLSRILTQNQASLSHNQALIDANATRLINQNSQQNSDILQVVAELRTNLAEHDRALRDEMREMRTLLARPSPTATP